MGAEAFVLRHEHLGEKHASRESIAAILRGGQAVPMQIGSQSWRVKVARPIFRTEAFPFGFGLELDHIRKTDIAIEEFIAQDATALLHLVRQYGALILKGTPIRSESDPASGFVYRQQISDSREAISWHYDRDGRSNRKLAAIIVGQRHGSLLRPVPTLIAPTTMIVAFIRKVVSQFLADKGLTVQDRHLYQHLAMHTDSALLTMIERFLDDEVAKSPFAMKLFCLMQLVAKKYQHTIITHHWDKQKDRVLLIDCEEHVTALGEKVCHVQHARGFNYMPTEENSDPGYELLKGYLYSDGGYLWQQD